MKNKKRKILNLIPLAMLSGITIWVLAIYSDLAQKLPTHYNLMGVADGWGDKSTLWILVGVSWGLYLMLMGMTLAPKKWMIKHMNGFDGCTQEGKEKAFEISMDMVQYINVIVTTMFSYMMIAVAYSMSSIMIAPFVVILVAVMVVQIFRMALIVGQHSK